MRNRQEEFTGFEPLSANYIYCPNQFLDVCLPNCSRGVTRIVAYVIRQTLGWLDSQGNPIQQEIFVSHRDLVKQAGVSKGAIGPALDDACRLNFLQRQSRGVACSKGTRGQSASYSLRWDDSGEYHKNVVNFAGFYCGEGHRTPVPNQFFDLIVRHESRAVAKVVGTVIRHTIGYQNQFGGRRTSAPLSHAYIGRYANLSEGRILAQAIQQAEGTGYITCIQQGRFAADSKDREPAQYSVKWLPNNASNESGSKRPTGNRFKKTSSNGSEKPAIKRFKKTSNRKTLLKDNDKQQDTAVKLAKEKLIDAGFDRRTATELASKRGLGVIERQINWLDHRNPRDSRVGMLRKAIEEDWEKPIAIKQREKVVTQRKRDTERDRILQLEDARVSESKAKRRHRKRRLQQVWDGASSQDRERWIKQAVDAETSHRIADLIRRQTPATSTPHIQVLEVIAKDRQLPKILVSET
ncbi:hypothetical protein KOR42_34010 [Thalassoglobus neptunius]|uniref:Uncharacterized protein n=1 Tax=Thalassoglobus neptunius TaxID=1938619 RepID=A0A5C5WLP6_9PLAN|nr:hypothetical protein [Thalassoglobus neptunius]TWT51714.1 hypothetical protein KOR42_34010 [Thalassoglobus neptunius]